MIDRRNLLKSLLPVAFMPQLTISGKAVSEAVALQSRHYLLFVDAAMVDVDALICGPCDLPEGTVINIVRVKLPGHKNIDDAVRMYELDNPGT